MKNQSENHEQHESVVQTLARYEQRIAELESALRMMNTQADALFKIQERDTKRIAELERVLRDVMYFVDENMKVNDATGWAIRNALGGDDDRN